jgi:hypothetical protein
MGIDPAVAADVLAAAPDDLVASITDVYAEEETRRGSVYYTTEASMAFWAIQEADWSQVPPEDRAAVAVYSLRVLANLGITKFDMGEAN